MYYAPLEFASNVSPEFILKGYEILFKKQFPYPDYLTDENVFRIWDKLIECSQATYNKEEMEVDKYLRIGGKYLFNEPGMNIKKEWLDTLSMLATCERWKKNKQVLTCTDDFIECLSLTEELKIPENIVEILPFDTFCLDLTKNKYFTDIDYAYVAFRKSISGYLQVHIIRILNDKIFFSLYILFEKEEIKCENGVSYYEYKKQDIPKQDTITVAMDAISTAGKKEVNNEKFSEMCIFIIQLALYISAANKDMSQSSRTKNTYRPKKDKKIKNKFSEIQEWNVGYIVGKTYSVRKEEAKAKYASGYSLTEKRRSPMPHVRKGHFQMYHVGKGRTETVIKWLEPIFVGGGMNESLPVVHKVI